MENFEDYAEALYLEGYMQALAGYPPTIMDYDFDEEYDCYMAGYDDCMESYDE